MRYALALLLLAVLAGSSFAALGWVENTGIAILIAVIVLALLYAFGHAFTVPELEMTSKDELYQILVVIIMVGAFGSITLWADGFSKSFSNGKSTTLQQLAKGTIATNIVSLNTFYSHTSSELGKVAIEGSRISSCSLLSMYVTFSGCGGFTALSTPISTSETLMAVGMVEMNSLQLLLDLSGTAVSLLFPMGIFLRVFKFTRPAGGVLIALAVSLYIVLPLSIVFIDSMGTDFAKTDTKYDYTDPGTFLKLEVPECDPKADPASESALLGRSPEDQELDFFAAMKTNMLKPFYLVFIKGTLFTIIYVFIMTTSIRYLSMLAGAEFDVTGIARLM